MKEIKYRSVQYDEEMMCYRFYYFEKGRYYNDNNETVSSYMFSWDNAEQFIGLYDKKQKEIYKGDIIKFQAMNELGIGIIEPFFGSVNLHCKWIKQETASPSFYTSIDYLMCSEEIEIIGNIHENPELIKVKS